jgi:hypothetical protein
MFRGVSLRSLSFEGLRPSSSPRALTPLRRVRALIVAPVIAAAGLSITGAGCEQPAITPFVAPHGGFPADDGDAGYGWARPAPGSPGVVARGNVDAGPEPPDLRTPSGFLLIGKERLELLRTRGRSAAGRSLDTLRENVDEFGRELDQTGSSVENVALMYLLTQQKRYGDLAWRWYRRLAQENVRGDSYLGFGDLMRGAALVLNWCEPALTPEQRKEIAEYLERWVNELWFDNKGTGWALKDPGNNYYYSFVEGTAYAAYALKAANRPSAQKLVELAHSKIEGPNGSLAYFEKGGRGGDWEEGSNYGLGSKRRMFSAFAAIASMGGPNYFERSPFVNASLLYASYQIQPGRRVLAPFGDIAREPTLSTSPFDREYVQIATYWSEDAIARGLGAWILKEVAPSFLMESGSLRWLFYRDVLFPTPQAMLRPNNQPLHYRSAGTEWINARSGWDDAATSLTFNATPLIEQSHAHFDTGAFLLYKNGWQAVDGNTYGHSGLKWESAAHNMITVKGQVRLGERSRGLVQYADDDKVMYAQVDATRLFTVKRGGVGQPETVLDEWTRELVYVRPSSLVVYDRVVPKPLGKDYSWMLHFAKKPSGADGRYTATNGGGGIGVAVLDGGPQRILEDSDVVDASTGWRLDMGPNATGRFLAVVQVATGAAPNVVAEAIAAPGIQGAAWADQVVVFSAHGRGQPAALPFTFKVKDNGAPRQWTLANMKSGCDVAITRADGTITVRVSAGSQHHVSEQGVVRFWQ